MSKALIEALKEFFRVVVLAIIPVAIVQIEGNAFDYKALLLVALIAGLRFIDKYLHEIGKVKADPRLINGLTQF